MEVKSRSTTPAVWQGARDAVLDVVANPVTLATFAVVITAGPLMMEQRRFPLLRRAACWAMRDGMRYTYYAGLGFTGGVAVHSAMAGDDYETAHAMTLGGLLMTTKFLGDRYMGPLLASLGRHMLQWSERLPTQAGQWLRTQGRALVQTSNDRVAASGLALCAHSMDEIAAFSMAIKMAIKTSTFREALPVPVELPDDLPPPRSLPPTPLPKITLDPITVAVLGVGAVLVLADGPLPFGDAAAASLVSARLAF